MEKRFGNKVFNKKSMLIGTLLITVVLVLCILFISRVENKNSVKINPIYIGLKSENNLLKKEEHFKIYTTASLKQEVNVGSLVTDFVADQNKSTALINDMKEMLSKIDDAKEIKGEKELIVPNNAHYTKLDAYAVYGWEKSYKKYFSSTEYSEMNFVLKLNDRMIHLIINTKESILPSIKWDIVTYIIDK